MLKFVFVFAQTLKKKGYSCAKHHPLKSWRWRCTCL